MATERMPITKKVLTAARERLGYTLTALAIKRPEFRKIAEWESGDSNPTYRQLELLAKDLWVPVAIFFFPEPPDFPEIEKTFRTVGSEQFAEIPPKIRLLLHKARAFQIGLTELNDDRNPARKMITKELVFGIDDDITDMAAQARTILGISLHDQFDWQDDDTALKSWRKVFYEVGVTVFKDAFREERYCGFSLYDDEFPIIYVNNSNTKTRQIFTLFHELAHLIFGTSGIDSEVEFENPLPANHRRIEIKCNRLAAEILVPEEALTKEIGYRKATKSLAETLAGRFCVSREVIFRKFLDRGLVSEAAYEAAKQEWDSQVTRRRGNGGGNFYRTRIAYLGEDYISLAFKRYYQDRIDEEELADYLAIKPKHLDQLEDMLFEASM